MDSGATSNFISEILVEKLNLKIESQKFVNYVVEVANGKKDLSLGLVKNMKLSFESFSEIFDFIVYPIPRYDIILGMKWLEKKNILIDCKEKKIREGKDNEERKTMIHPERLQRMLVQEIFQEGIVEQEKEIMRKKNLNEEVSLINQQICSLNSIKKDRKSIESVFLFYFHAEEEDLEGKVENSGVPGQAKELLASFSDIFPEDLPSGLPPIREVDHEIKILPESLPPSKMAYRISPADSKELRSQLDDLLKKGFIKSSVSPYGAPVLFVRKKDGSVRMCIDYRSLNRITLKNTCSMPRIDEVFDQLKGAKIFSKLDLTSGFHQIRVKESDVEKTAFNTKFGHFEFRVLPFGLTNAPATFMTLMRKVFLDFLDVFVCIFLDDILVYSKSEGDHLVHLKLVLERLRSNRLFAKLTKCQWFKTKIPFLGHIITDEGITVDQSKIDCINNWPIPKNQEEVRSFLGLAGFYRRFVKGFSHIASPMTALLQKNLKFQWNDLCSKAFETLKQSLTSSPILIVPDTALPFTVTTDASKIAAGAILQQDLGKGLQPIAFLSHKLNRSEQNYPIHEQELLAIILALKEWRHYLHGSSITVITDHHSLQWLQTQTHLSARQTRWLEFLQEFQPGLIIKYRPGRENVVADALSRIPDRFDNSSSLFLLSTISTSNLLQEINLAYEKDIEIQGLKKRISNLKNSPYQIKENLIFYRGRLFLPNDRSLKTKIIYEAHDAAYSGHLGQKRTEERLRREFTWKGLSQDVIDYVSSCVSCASAKASTKKPIGLLHQIEIPSKRWETISMDFIGPLIRTKDGHNCILVVVDKLTKMNHFIAMRTNMGAEEVARLIFDNIIRLHGFPKKIISDRDSRFTSKFWTALWSLSGTKLAMSTAYHPQSDGQTERANKTLEEILRSYVNLKANDWDQHLAGAEIAYNSSIHSSSGFSPFYLNYGEEISLPLDFVSTASNIMNVPAASSLFENFKSSIHSLQRQLKDSEINIQKARSNLEKAQEQQKKQADKKRREEIIKKGDLVMLETANIKSFENKLMSKFIGPFEVEEVSKDGLGVTLNLPDTMRIHKRFHVSKIKAISGVKENLKWPNREQMLRPAPILVNDQKEYEVEAILGEREFKTKNGKREKEYLVKWSGYPESDSSWEIEENLGNAQEKLEEFYIRQRETEHN